MNARRIVVTGASGFVGAALLEALGHRGREVVGAVRETHGDSAPALRAVGDLAQVQDTVLDALLEGADALVHLAGRAHVMHEHGDDNEASYRLANVESTRRLARAAVRNHVGRFVLASTVKVNGESTLPGRPFTPQDPPRPQDAYARSKLEAERTLFEALASAGTAPVVLRLPLVYGRNAKGNFARLAAAVAAGAPLPLASIRNRRSLVYLGNLIDAIEAVVDAPLAPVGVHFVADDESPSTTELVRAIARALRKPPRLVPVPVSVLRVLGAVSGRSAMVQRLTESLELDTTSLRIAVTWRPRWTLQEALQQVLATEAGVHSVERNLRSL